MLHAMILGAICPVAGYFRGHRHGGQVAHMVTPRIADSVGFALRMDRRGKLNTTETKPPGIAMVTKNRYSSKELTIQEQPFKT